MLCIFHTYRPIGLMLRLLAIIVLLSGCNATRFVPETESLLSSVKITTDNKQIRTSEYRPYIRQNENARWFNLVKVPLGFYCLSGQDSTKAMNRFFRKIGEPPVIYSEKMQEHSRAALTSALQSKGFLHASVTADTITKKRRTKLTYRMHPGKRFFVTAIHYEFDDAGIEKEIKSSASSSLLYKGMPMDLSVLNAERNRIIRNLKNRGYYRLHKEFISFRADTMDNDYGIELTLRFARPAGSDSSNVYTPYRLRDVTIHEEISPYETADTSEYRGLRICYDKKLRMQRRVYHTHVFIRPDSMYREANTQNTYGALGSLSAINYSNIRFKEVPEQEAMLDCDISVRLNKPHSVSAELEGTNTSGDLGAAVAFTYNNRNIFRGAENLSLKVRGAYEAITGLEGYSNANYVEYSAEASLRFPTFMFPLLPFKVKQRLKANSEISLLYNSQNRPEFHRRVLTGSWLYRWSRNGRPKLQHRLDMLSLNYVFMPWISNTFRKEYLEGEDPRYSILRYSYENLFIMKFGYGFVYNSQHGGGSNGLYQTNDFQLRMNIETAGNLLYGLSRLFKASKDGNQQYNIFNIAYSQYAKFDFDYAKSFLINERNSLAIHAAFGIALPYGNSTIIPYEKRYFAGGANSIRGWSVRELGPGSYVGQDGKIDFINQTGNLKLDLSMEYRTQLFWKFHGAFFIDAGNIWNTRNYPDQPGGTFHFDSFHRQIAVSYGLGIRFNLDYFILRFDGGMKAVNPAVKSGPEHFPLWHPNFHRDFTFHFAVGLPF